jgi:membrane dipeptidase
MLRPGWIVGHDDNLRNPRVMLSHVVDHIDPICQITGDTSHVAIGSDLDGWFGRESTSYDVDTIADPQITAPLWLQGRYAPPDIVAIRACWWTTTNCAGHAPKPWRGCPKSAILYCAKPSAAPT